MLTAKLVGEGYARPNADNELPLDINYAKLNEWLVSALLVGSTTWACPAADEHCRRAADSRT